MLTKLAESLMGVLLWATNELRIISKVEDPAALRLGAPKGIALGKISGDRIRIDGNHEEMILIQFKQDERTRDDPNAYWGEITVHLRGPGGDEGNMHLVATVRHDYAQLHVPIRTKSGIEA